ncbi:MAG: hypothetical protein A2293_04980 [Elusimicrobia bacterium RIFOXYB2_FULL_49_7]|nr:MAG: hypothetical protein A2293_04980 [Elusimicrobia bacterium RIFOXYB2_FULL_49_7]
MKTDIRPETKDDFKDIRAVNVAAFGPEGQGKAAFVDKLRQTKRFVPELSLTAKHYGKVVGHILFYPIDILQGDKKVETLSLALLSVLPAFQNKGVGSKLVKVGLSKAKKLDFQSVIVLGHEKYYPRFGFTPLSTYGITSTINEPDHILMALELEPETLKTVNGILQYPEEFDGV